MWCNYIHVYLICFGKCYTLWIPLDFLFCLVARGIVGYIFQDSCPGLGHAAHLQQARRPTAGVLWVRGMLLAPNPGRPGLARLVTACG